MSVLTQKQLKRSPVAPRAQRIESVIAPLDTLARNSASLLAAEPGRFHAHGQDFELPRYLFIGPRGGSEPIRLGLFAGIHGDEPAGAHALVRLVELLESQPELARGYCLFLYPICNPSGFADGTRQARSGRDLNREFWRGSVEPEVELLETELWSHALDGIVTLHSDDTSEGFYGFASGALFSEHLLRPALAAAGELLPLNQHEVIDGFRARAGVIREGYPGVLSAPPKLRPKPFEIILESPGRAPAFVQETALVVGLTTILAEYRKFIAYGANL